MVKVVFIKSDVSYQDVKSQLSHEFCYQWWLIMSYKFIEYS